MRSLGRFMSVLFDDEAEKLHDNALENDPVAIAHRKWKSILERTELYSIDGDRRRAIENVVEKARAALSSIEGATM